jgi:DNA-binding SARP family transcriptional activator
MFTLNLLGPVSAAIDGNQFTRFGTSRGQALLIYLALERERAHQREAIMHLLWPDMPLKSAQGNLRQTLYLLRKGFQEKGVDVSPILSTRQTVQIRPDFPLAVDVHEFEMGTGGGTPEKEQEAADLYRGPFLSDFFLPDSEPFEAWAAEKRATYGRLALDNLDRLAAHHLYGTEYAAAETAARRALALDDLYEPAHRYLMQALAGDGKRGDALDALRFVRPAACRRTGY